MDKVSVLILTGYGINCDVETGWAFTMAGAHRVERVHINRIINGEVDPADFQIMVFPGGFSFGDHIASGRVLGLKIKKEMGEKVAKFVRDGKLVLGICNGFQTLVKMGILPGDRETVFGKQVATLTHNDSAKYEDRWVRIKANHANNSPFLRGIDAFDVAVRHGEGKFMAQKSHLRDIKNNNLIAFQYVDKSGEPAKNYPENPNGSELSIAGITNDTGTVLGLMPHPEVFINTTHHPHWTRNKGQEMKGDGLKLFQNAVNYVLKEL